MREETSTAGITSFYSYKLSAEIQYRYCTCSTGTNSQHTRKAQYRMPCPRRKPFPLLQPLICHDKRPVRNHHPSLELKLLNGSGMRFFPLVRKFSFLFFSFLFFFLLFFFYSLPTVCRLTCLPDITPTSIAGETSPESSRPAVSKGKRNNSPTPPFRVPYLPPINRASIAKAARNRIQHTKRQKTEGALDQS